MAVKLIESSLLTGVRDLTERHDQEFTLKRKAQPELTILVEFVQRLQAYAYKGGL